MSGVSGALRYTMNVDILGRAALRVRRWQAEWQARSASRWKSEVLAPPLKISPWTKELIGRQYLKGNYANLHQKVAWVTSGAPVEFLKALDFYVLYPENHGAVCGTMRVAEQLCTEAENAGYSRDICSYARTDIGVMLSGKTPVGRLPRPDLLLACTNICQTVLFWYRVLAHHFHAPLIVIDTPFIYTQVTEHALDFVKRQIEEAIPVAEKVAGKSLQARRLEQVAQLSLQASRLWMEIIERCQHRPAPISVFDQFIQMAPIVEMRGDPDTVDFYAAMLKEVGDRINRGVGVVKNERKRLLWDNLPIWYRLRYLAEYLGQHGIAIVASTYTNAWGELADRIDTQDPIDGMAKTYIYPILNRGTGDKLATMQAMIQKYQLDGVILHSDRSCKPYSMGQISQRDRLARDCGVPALLLEADHNDPRAYTEEQVANRLDAFIEMLGV
jgi:benzoyl-CoA reductase/2-hydroxyglutaryl-CoA dehydratase subunit BcrC/BadD/HgdB